jgi:CBS domain containing-hemolysin-like protein
MTPMSEPLALVIAIALLLGNAFFVGAEFALVAARRTRIEPKADAGSARARSTLAAMRQVSLMMAGAQLGITLCTLGLGAVGEPAVAHLLEPLLHALSVPESWLHPVALVVATLVVVAFHVVVGEMVPKNIALAGPDRAALVLGPPLVLVVRVLRPPIALFNWIANGVLRLIGIEPRDEVTSAFTRDEVAGLVEESRREGLLDPHEGRLLVGALSFEERDVRSVLLPIDTLETVSPQVTPRELEEVAAATGYSRFPVCDKTGLIGYLHLKDVLEFEDVHRNRPIARAWIRALPTVAQTDRLRSVLATMQRSGAHLARVDGPHGEALGSLPWRTCSRSSSARSATRSRPRPAAGAPPPELNQPGVNTTSRGRSRQRRRGL